MKGIYWLGLGIALFQACLINPCFAQSSNIVPDNTLGAESSQVLENFQGLPVEIITGGAERGINLFHSFQEFNVSEGRGTYFFSPNAEIQNILARVTGRNLSDVLGILGTLGGSQPNLFLINPNGIVFGENASLDVGGSFVASTANAIEFGKQGLFSASNPQTPGLLNVSPSALFFNAVANQKTNSIESQAFLTVPESKSLLLLGGNISPNTQSTGNIILNGGRLRAPGGRVEIAGLGESGKVDLNHTKNQLSLGFPEDIKRVDVSLLNIAEIDVTAGGGGDISIYAQNLDILEGSDICAGIGADESCGGLNLNNGSANAQAGDITLDATEKITIANPVSEVNNNVNSDAIGNSGNINIGGKSIEINDGAIILAITFGKGNAGSINIFAEDTVSIKDSDGNNSFIANNIRNNAIGDSGGINITTGSLFVNDGAQIKSLVYGKGNSGRITINARDQVSFDGRDTNDFPSSALTRVEVGAVGNGGGIDINTNFLSITNRAQIASVTQGRGNASDISINAQSQVSLLNSDIITEVSEEGGIGIGGDININTGALLLQDGSSLLADVENFGKAGNITINVGDRMVVEGEGLSALRNSTNIVPSQISTTVESGAEGEGGNIDISANSLSIDDAGFISSRTAGKGNAGNIKLKARNEIIVKGIDSDGMPSSINAIVGSNAVGDGGNIEISANSLSIEDGGFISSRTAGKGNAGSIKLKASNEIILKGKDSADLPSAITATVGSNAVGDGGNIDITTGLLSLNDGGIISSDTSGDGKAGNLNIKTNNLTLRNDARVSVSTFGKKDAGDLNIITDFLRLEDTSQFGTVTLSDGNAGTLRIKASEIIQLIGSLDENRVQNGGLFASAIEGSGNGGDLILETDKLIVQDGATISASNFQSTNQRPPGTGSPGNLNIDAGSVTLDNQGSITTATSVGSDENKGNISINIRDNLTATNSTISTTSEQSSGGAIDITAQDIRLFGDSDIATNVFSGAGGGGNISLTANTIIALDDSDILSFARDGKGGDIKFNTVGFFSKPLYRPNSPTTDTNANNAFNNNNQVDINASGTVSGAIAGVPDVTFIDNELTDLPDNQIDTNALIANSCISRSTKRQENSFTITGSGGLRKSPGDELVSQYSTGEVRSVEPTSRTWKKGDRIVEPTGVYQLSDGKILLSRGCSS
ncbi:filamentous hemagglutinin family N-terminal domain protein [Rivularia sp. PCC 7116]|uniref:two-partner secretion domain-containing protein n=1 Tax=Rivularia sp. PCC 7116 TaxID=373994 RepID=UPI00029F41EB|nr:filamentous hemagglutinin N-terminal domain-containing protein [Rivularia sp. PCC 7116]AFY55534.1 filamentous hemagglutinin family N-terminal domain protein [Rivularia sp. PCC 7116]